MSLYQIHEIAVTSHYKSWNHGINQNQGDSVGSEITWTVKPSADPVEYQGEVSAERMRELLAEHQPTVQPSEPVPAPSGWTPAEAKQVVLQVRREQQAVLIIEAEACGVALPNMGVQTISSLDKAIAKCKENAANENK